MWWVMFLLVTINLLARPASADSGEIRIDNCADIHALTREQAAERHVVKLRGVVTYVESEKALVIQDRTDGVYVEGKEKLFQRGEDGEPRIGSILEVSGETAPGVFAPMVRAKEIRIVGEGTLPPPVEARAAEIRAGLFDCRRITVRGVVQRAFREDNRDSPFYHPEFAAGLRMEMSAYDGPFTVFVKDPGDFDPADLVDAELALTGTCYTLSNPRGESIGAALFVQDSSGIEILKGPTPDPYSVPRAPSFALRPYSKDGPYLHRQLLEGTVTLSKPNEFLYLQMGERAVRVNTRSAETLSPGDNVLATGFVDQSRGFAQLNEALVRKTGRGPLPEPLRVTPSDILSWENYPNNELLRFEDYDGAMIRLKGRLVSVENGRDNSPRLVMDADGVAVVAHFATGGTSSDLARLLPGSEVEVTGICSLTLAENWPRSFLPIPERFSVLLRSPDSVRIIRQPPWWTAARLKNALLAMSVLLAFSVAAVVFLRRAVAHRSAQLADELRARQERELALHDAEVEFKATLAERERVAADLHDTLEQALTGVAMQLEAIKTAPSSDLATRNLNLASQMLAVSREDVRRSVWNLRTEALEGRSFLGALERVANTVLDYSPISFSLEATSEEHRISDFVASNLLILTKEALTNSVKHSKATHIVVSVSFGQEAITLVFRDNGCGFTQDAVPGPHEGHFGLTGMRERVARLSGRFSIESRPGAGTTIIVFVPAEKDADPGAANSAELLAAPAENNA